MNISTEEETNRVICSWIADTLPRREVKQVMFTWYFANAIVNAFLAFAATCGNILILFALQKGFTLSPPSKVLFRSLATSDLCVGLISQPLFAASILLIGDQRRWDVCRLMRYSTYILSTTLCGVSLLTLTAISVDRLLVLLLRFRYRTVVTQSRMKAVVGCFWITSLATSIVFLKSRRIFFAVAGMVIILNITISSISYATIFLVFHRRQNRIEDQPGQVNRFRFNRSQRFKKTVYSALWVHSAMIACYLPFSIIVVLAARMETTLPLFIAGSCNITLIYFNSTINPFLYCWRIREVRQAVKKVITFCSSRP